MRSEVLKPQLQSNRKEWDVLGRRQWQALGVALLFAVPLAIVVPPDYHQMAFMLLLGMAFAAFCYLELRRVFIFRRDIRERKRLGLPLGPTESTEK